MELINKSLVSKIIDIASKHESINRIGIFGSYARGDNNQTSDIDLLYDYDDSKIDDTIRCLGEIMRQFDTNVDFVAYDDLLRVRDKYDVKFRDNVLNDVVWIYG